MARSYELYRAILDANYHAVPPDKMRSFLARRGLTFQSEAAMTRAVCVEQGDWPGGYLYRYAGNAGWPFCACGESGNPAWAGRCNACASDKWDH